MQNQTLDTTVASDDYEDIMVALKTVREKLPFLIGLTPNQRRGLVRMGDKSRAFVEQSLDVAKKYPLLMPGNFDLQKAERDMQLFEALTLILLEVKQLEMLLEDTHGVAGSEVYASARTIYRSVKANGKGMGLDEVIADLGRRFRRSGRSGKSQNTVAG